MTAILNDESSPAHCGLVTYPTDTLARLLHVPAGMRIDTILKRDDGWEVLLSGDETTGLPRVEPGYPVPAVQLVAIVDNGVVVRSSVLPIDADVNALNTGEAMAT